MRFKELVGRLYNETGIMSGKSKIGYYERLGLIAPRREGNNYRDFTDKEYEKIKFVSILTDLGICTKDIKEAIRCKDGSVIRKKLEKKEKNIELAYTQL